MQAMNKNHSPYTLRQQLEAFAMSTWIGTLHHCFYFYDWFCRDHSLERKAKALVPKVKKFIKAMNIDVDGTYVFFKNNCPFNGSLYDDFRICNVATGDVIYTVVPCSGHGANQAELWGASNNFQEPIATASNWKQLLANLPQKVVD
jgi:hypothetical protein